MPTKCKHNRRKSRCKECEGSEICEHNRIKSTCRECHGSQICEHNRRKSTCIECRGSEICEHNRRKSTCRECHGSQICEHNRKKSQCKECRGSSICEHNIQKSTCRECRGSEICEHNKRKSRCKECNGSALCKSSWCERCSIKKYEGYCLNCFINIFPDRPNTRNYKTKEASVVQYILEKFPNFTWVADKKIQDGCSKKRPDLLLDLGDYLIITEIDENQHESYDCSCENKRLMELSQDVGHRPIVFIRFNPDEYYTNDGKITSCWGINGNGICAIKKSKQNEWTERLEALHSQIKYWSENKTEKTLEIVQLFYDCD